MKKVALISGNNRQKNIKKALRLIENDLQPIKQAETILIKPNLTGLFRTAGNTQKQALIAVLEFLKEFCPNFKHQKIYLFEGSGDAYYFNSQTKNIFKKMGYFDLTRKYPNLLLKPIETEKSYFEEEIETFKGPVKIRIAQIYKKADFNISLSLPKTHDYVIFTGGLKNFIMAGIHQEDKHLMHGFDHKSILRNNLKARLPSFLIYNLAKLRGKVIRSSKDHQNHYQQTCQILHQNLARLGKKIFPDLVILDAWEIMEGAGPVRGEMVPFKLAIASTDSLKADALAARIMGLDPEKIKYLYFLGKNNPDSLYPEGLIGERNWHQYRRKIKLHPNATF